MPQDAFTLNFLCAELCQNFLGGKINKIVQPDNDTVIFTVYAKNKTEKLLISANPSMPRIGVCDQEFDIPLTAPNFCMLLRKHLLSATITGISLVGFDRIVKIDLTPSSEYFDDKPKTLFLELMGRYSNVILTEENKILGANRGVNVFDNGVRPLFVGKTYVFPPVGDKKLPTDTTLVEYFAQCDKNFAKHLCDGVQGLALSTANEIVNAYQTKTGREPQSNAKDFFAFFNDFIYRSDLTPCVYLENGKVTDVCALQYHLNKGEIKFFDTLYQAENYYFNNVVSSKQFASKIERVSSLINSAIKRAKKKLNLLVARQKDALDFEKNKIFGELILSNFYAIKKGDEYCQVLNYYDNTTVTIPLDVNLTPQRNAERYFKKYNKQKRTLEVLEPQLKAIEDELEYLDSVLSEVKLCETVSEVDLILAEITLTGYAKNTANKNSVKKKAETFCREYLCDGYIIKVGRNNTENDKLTFSAKPFDVWVHVKDYHSSHVIIENPTAQEVPQKILTVASEICAYYSKARQGGKAEVVYTTRKNIKKPPKSKPGFCIYENFKSITVIPNKRQEFLKTE